MNETQKEICELAEVIYEKPLSGAFDEVSFGSDKGNTLWVKFSDKNGLNEWIGKFGDQGWGARRVIKVAEPDIFSVCAGDVFYLVEATNRKLLNQFEKSRVNDAIFDPISQCFIIADDIRLHVIKSGKAIWSSKRVALDGIRDLKLEGRIVSGLALVDYDGNHADKEEKFTLNLDTREVNCPIDFSLWECESKSFSSKRPWWKFW